MIDVKVSVIIPFFENLDWLYQAVDSVFKQTYKNIEVIIINDGSQEDVTSFVEKYSDRMKYIYQENKGAAYARNVGIDISQGEYIAFLDSDDMWEPKKIELQVSYMVQNNIVWSHTSYSTFGGESENKIVNVSNYQKNVFPICIISCPIATPCVMIQSSIFKTNQDIRFGTGMKSGEDTVLWMNLAMRYEVGVINMALTRVRMRGTNSALLAYSQIRAKSDIFNYIKEKNVFDVSETLNAQTRFAFYFCDIFYKLLNRLDKNNTNEKDIIEVLSKLFYLIPWIIFKNEKRTYFRRDV